MSRFICHENPCYVCFHYFLYGECWPSSVSRQENISTARSATCDFQRISDHLLITN